MALRPPSAGGIPPHPADVIAPITAADLASARVVFINMPLRETALPNVPPEGPLLMATRLRNEYGVHATVLDLNGYRIHDAEAGRNSLPNGRHLSFAEAEALLVRHYRLHGQPHVVAFSGMITTLRWQEAVARMIRRLVPATFLVSGNGLATELKTGLFRYIPELDAVADSEGDDIIVKIVHDALSIHRTGWRSAVTSGKLEPYYLGHDGSRHRLHYRGNRPRDLDGPIADLELLREDVDGHSLLEDYLRAAVWGTSANNSSAAPFTMERSTTSVSSRGCPFECAFCFRGSQGERNWGIRSPEHLASQVRLHKEKYGIDFIGYPDDNFAVNPKRIADMIPLFRDLDIRWGTHTRLDEAADLRPGKEPNTFKIADPRRIDLMAQAGCVYIGFGAESASPSVLTAMKKGGHILANGTEMKAINGRRWDFPRTMMEGITACENAGIHSNCTWIMAYPTESLDDLKTSVAFMAWQEQFYGTRGKGPETVNKRIFTATWYPGTEMLDHPKVRQTLHDVFGINFEPKTGEPVVDEFLHNYILELDDATKLLHDPRTGEPLNYSDMPMDTFLRARELVDQERTLEILDL